MPTKIDIEAQSTLNQPDQDESLHKKTWNIETYKFVNKDPDLNTRYILIGLKV